MDDGLLKIIAGTGGAGGVIWLLFQCCKYLINQVKENRECADKRELESRKIYLDSHQQTVQMARDIAIETQRHLDDCHKDNKELSSRQARLETRYADLSQIVIKMGHRLPSEPTQDFTS